MTLRDYAMLLSFYFQLTAENLNIFVVFSRKHFNQTFPLNKSKILHWVRQNDKSTLCYHFRENTPSKHTTLKQHPVKMFPFETVWLKLSTLQFEEYTKVLYKELTGCLKAHFWTVLKVMRCERNTSGEKERKLFILRKNGKYCR